MKKLLLALSISAAVVSPAAAEDFFSTEDASQLCTIGARIGVNSSNRTVGNTMATLWNHNSWGTGFDIGAVADINFKNFISVQPGFFFESRSGSFAYETLTTQFDGSTGNLYQLGKGREYLFTIPIVASFHFNVMENVRWNVDFGPYFQIKLKSTFDGKFDYPASVSDVGIYYYTDVKTARGDVGLKMGTGVDIFEHYYVGVHYLAGLCRPWNPGKIGGHNKAWVFSIGYNF